VKRIPIDKLARLALKMMALGLVLAAAPSARAQLLQSGPFNSVNTIPSTQTDWVDSLIFPKFDPSLGTLVRVEISLTVDISTDYFLTNNSPSSSAIGDISTTVRVILLDPAPQGLPGNPGPPPQNGSPGVNQWQVSTAPLDYNIAPSSTFDPAPIEASSTSTNAITIAAFPTVIPDFIAASPGDNITMTAYTRTTTSVNNSGGNFTFDQVTNAAVSGTITYFYVVPEPGTLSLLVVGMVAGGAGIARRRIRRS
jgi:hypothetical protein